MGNNISMSDQNNKIIIHDSNKEGITISINGQNNTVEIGECQLPSRLKITIKGNFNSVRIRSILCVKDLTINVGTHVAANRTELDIGTNISMKTANFILMHNSGNVCRIGDNCLFSNSITIRCGESPHLLFDKETGEYIDISEGVFIGNHVWVGEKVYIMKNVTVPDECVIGAGSVVTKRFTEENCIIAGNPARVVKQNIQWIKNHGHLEKDSKYYRSYWEYMNRFR